MFACLSLFSLPGGVPKEMRSPSAHLIPQKNMFHMVFSFCEIKCDHGVLGEFKLVNQVSGNIKCAMGIRATCFTTKHLSICLPIQILKRPHNLSSYF